MDFARRVEHPDKPTRSRPRTMVDDEAEGNLQFGPFELSSGERELRREGEVLLRILHGDSLLEAIFEGDFQANGDRPDVVVDVFEIVADGHGVSLAHYGGVDR